MSEKDIEKCKLKKVIEFNSIYFNHNTIPKKLVDSICCKDVIVLGEMHYIQQHQEFLANLIKEIHKCGFRQIINELMHAFSWIAEDYVTGKIDSLPENIMYFDYEYLKKIREFNMGLCEEEKIIVKYNDVNHWDNNFIESAKLIDEVIDTYGIFSEIKEMDTKSDSYYEKLVKLNNELNINSDIHNRKLTYKWYKRIKEMVEIEIESFKQRRAEYNPKTRERVMIQLSKDYLLERKKTVINCGGNHAQKRHFSGPGKEYQLLGEFINNNYNSYAIGVIGIKGEIKNNFRDLEGEKFNVLESSVENDMFRIIGEKQEEKNAFIPFSDSVFDNVFLATSCTDEVKVKPKYQFDAYISYPKVDIVNSMRKFKYNIEVV